MRRAAEFVVEAGYASVPMIAAALDVDDDRAVEIIVTLIDDGVITETADEAEKHDVMMTDLSDYRPVTVLDDGDDGVLDPGDDD